MNLIICTTPFQVMLAEKIIEKHPNEEFYGIFFFQVKNKKYTHYSNILSKACKKYSSYYVNPAKSKALYIATLIFLRVKSAFLKNKIDKIFVSSIDGINIHFLLSSMDMTRTKIYTYDDGTANIVEDSFFYKRIRRKLDCLGYILGNKHNIDSLKKMSVCHYSIYEQKNIIDNVVRLNLIGLNSFREDKKSTIPNRVSIFLGQPIYELVSGLYNKDDMNVSLCSLIVNLFNVDYYFPHPRENYKISNVEYIDTELIFEDFFAKHYDPNINYTLYTFFSGCVLSFVNLDNVEVVSIKPSNCPSEFLSSYKLFSNMGINIIEISEKDTEI